MSGMNPVGAFVLHVLLVERSAGIITAIISLYGKTGLITVGPIPTIQTIEKEFLSWWVKNREKQNLGQTQLK